MAGCFPATGKVIKETCEKEFPDEFSKELGPTWMLRLRTTLPITSGRGYVSIKFEVK
jgi:hypothetical protein